MRPASEAYLPDDPDLALRHLAHGVELARTKLGDRAGHADAIWALLEEAVETMDRLPDRERGWLRIGSTAAGFDGSGLTRRELQALEQLRYLSGMKPYDGPTARVIDRSQAARAFDVMLWFRFVGAYVQARDPERMVRAAVALARGGDCEAFHRIWRPGSKPHRQAVKNFRIQFCGHVLQGLRNRLHIVAVCGGGFAPMRDFPTYFPEAAGAAL